MRQFLFPLGLFNRRVEEGQRYGEANDRCMAAAIDISLLFLVLSHFTGGMTAKVYALFGQSPPTDTAQISTFAALLNVLWEVRYPWFVSNGLIFLLMGVAIVTCQTLYGTTPGKWLLGLKIVRQGTFEPVARWRYALRYLAYIPSCVPLMIGIFWISFNKERRGWHDYIAGTVVINTRPRGWYWGQVKKGFRWLYAKLTGSVPLEQTVGEPAAEQRHEDGDQPIR